MEPSKLSFTKEEQHTIFKPIRHSILQRLNISPIDHCIFGIKTTPKHGIYQCWMGQGFQSGSRYLAQLVLVGEDLPQYSPSHV